MNTTARIASWVTTGILVFVLVSGGIGEFFHLWGTLDTVSVLGYPAYLLDIIGAWKILAALALVVPASRTLREWAYAGIVFNMTGAAASHVLASDFGPYAFHVVVTLGLAALALAARALDAQRTDWSGVRAGLSASQRPFAWRAAPRSS